MPLDENPCVICLKLKSSYKCPKCRSVYCSLQCSKAHKAICLSSSRQTEVATLPQKDRPTVSCKLAVSVSESSDRQEPIALLTSQKKTDVAQVSLISESFKVGTDDTSPKIINQEAVKIALLDDICNNYCDDESENSDEAKTGTTSEIITDNTERKDEMVIDEVLNVETATRTDSSSSGELIDTEQIQSAASTQRLHRDVDSNDTTILTSSTAQNVLQSVWVRNMLKSSRLRDDIIKVDSSQNRQGIAHTTDMQYFMSLHFSSILHRVFVIITKCWWLLYVSDCRFIF